MGNKGEKRRYKDEQAGVIGSTVTSEMGSLEDVAGLHRPRRVSEATLGDLGDDTGQSIASLVHGL
jgi:hypothetical protein